MFLHGGEIPFGPCVTPHAPCHAHAHAHAPTKVTSYYERKLESLAAARPDLIALEALPSAHEARS